MKIIDILERHYRTLPAYQIAKSSFAATANPKLKGGYLKQEGDAAFIMFNDYMRKNGFNKLGQGSFGAVYERPGYPWIFKLFANDAAYKAWIDYVVQNQGNEHLPKIRGKPFKINDGVFAVRMEKLDNLPKNWDQNPVIDTIMYSHIKSSKTKEKLTNLGHADLIPVLEEIEKLAYDDHSKNWAKDLHSANLMMRGNIPVITDPIVDSDAFKIN